MPQSAPSETGKKPEKSKFYEIGKEGGPAKSSAEIVNATTDNVRDLAHCNL